MRRFSLHLLLSLSLVLASSRALAQQAPAGRLLDTLQQKAQQTGIGCYVRQAPNGTRRLYLNPSGGAQLQAVEAVLHRGSNSLELCHIGSPQANHTMGILNRQLVHVQYRNGTNNWRLRNWGNGLRASESKLYSAVIELTASEARRMQEQLDGGFRAQGEEFQAGPNWENGNLRKHSPRSFNCVSYFSEMPIGDNGEPLWRVLGLPASYSGNPRGLMNALEQHGNNRVVGICVYGPRLPDFTTTPTKDKFTFN